MDNKTKPKKGPGKGNPGKPRNPNKRNELGIRQHTYARFKPGIHYEPIEEGEMPAIIGLIQARAKFDNITPTGRPRLYDDINDFKAIIEDFWNYMATTQTEEFSLIPDVEGFCTFAGISRETLNEWERSRDFRYSATIKELKNNIAWCKKQLALRGKIPPLTFATDFNNNHGYRQKQEVEISAKNPLGEAPDTEELTARLLKSSEGEEE